jgi:ERCC4-type nuclease
MLTIVIDTREQDPLEFSPNVRTVLGTLPIGDYSVKGFESHVALERKSLADYLASISTGRERFARELRAMRRLKFAGLLCEFSFTDLIAGEWRNDVAPSAAIGSLLSFPANYGVVPLLAGGREAASSWAEKVLTLWVEKRIDEFRRAMGSLGYSVRISRRGKEAEDAPR